jgi:hypothetical protein
MLHWGPEGRHDDGGARAADDDQEGHVVAAAGHEQEGEAMTTPRTAEPNRKQLIAGQHAKLLPSFVRRLAKQDWVPITVLAKERIDAAAAAHRVDLDDRPASEKPTGKARIALGRDLLTEELVPKLVAKGYEVRDEAGVRQIRWPGAAADDGAAKADEGRRAASDGAAVPESEAATRPPEEADRPPDEVVMVPLDGTTKADEGYVEDEYNATDADDDGPTVEATTSTPAAPAAEVKAAADELPCHPVAEFFPLLEGREHEELKADIKEHGLREPIWLHEGRIIDGRNRYRACRELSIKPATREWDGKGSLVAFVVSQNMRRRHLSTSQRALIAARLKPLFEAEARQRMLAGKAADPEAFLPQGRSRDQAAVAARVSPRTVDAADKVLQQGCPELVEAVKADKVSVTAAAAVAGLPREEQEKAVAGGRPAVQDKAREARQKGKKQAEGSADRQADAAGPPASNSGVRPDHPPAEAGLTLAAPVTPMALVNVLRTRLGPRRAVALLRAALRLAEKALAQAC